MQFTYSGGSAREQSLFTSALAQFTMPCLPNLYDKVTVTWTPNLGHVWTGVVTTARDVAAQTATLAVSPTLLTTDTPPGVDPERWYLQAVAHGVADLVADRLFPSEVATLVAILGGSWTGPNPLEDNTRFAAAEILKDLYMPLARWSDNRSRLTLPPDKLNAFVDAYLPPTDLTHNNTFTTAEFIEHTGTQSMRVDRPGATYMRDLTWHWKELACQPGLPDGLTSGGVPIVYKDFDVGRRSQQLRMEWDFSGAAWPFALVSGSHGFYPGSYLPRSVVTVGYGQQPASGSAVANWPSTSPRNAIEMFGGPDEWPRTITIGGPSGTPWVVTPPSGGTLAYDITDYFTELDPADFSRAGFSNPYSPLAPQKESDPSTSFGHAMTDSGVFVMRDRNAWVPPGFVEQPTPPQVLSFNFGLRTGPTLSDARNEGGGASGVYRFVAPPLGAPYPSWPYVSKAEVPVRVGRSTLLFGQGDATSPPSRDARQQPRVL